MGRKSEIAEEDIIRAGKRILGEARTVTGWTLREALGQKGQPRYLEGVWTRWTEANAPKAPPAPIIDLPEEVTDLDKSARAEVSQIVGDLVMKAWTTAHDIMQRRLAGERADIEARTAAHVERMNQAERSIEEADRTKAILEAQIQDLTERLNSLTSEAFVLSDRLSVSDRVREELLQKTKALEGDLADAEAIVTAARQAMAVAEAKVEASDNSRDAAVSDAAMARQEAVEAKTAAARSDARAEAAEATAKRLRCDIETLTRDLAVAQTAAAAAQAMASAREAEIERVRADRLEAEIGRRDAEAALAAVNPDTPTSAAPVRHQPTTRRV